MQEGTTEGGGDMGDGKVDRGWSGSLKLARSSEGESESAEEDVCLVGMM